MKFLENHRKDILSILASHSLTDNDFLFKKKKGRIIIELKEKDWFSFYKKDDFFIDPDTSLSVDIGFFEVKSSSSEPINLNLWSEVISELRVWLNKSVN